MANALLILILLLNTTTNSQQTQQPASAPTTPIFDACWQIESDPPCNDDYYANYLGCHFDTFDTSCMCRVTDNNINVIYLVDITTNAVPTPSEFNNLTALIQDVTNSTLVISSTDEIFNQIILYDENQYPQTENIDPMTIDINQYTRTQLNELSVAIQTAIDTFGNLDGKRRVLVIFNGQMQKDYTQDDVDVCQSRSLLVDEEITVIIVSYTPYDDTETARDLICLVDVTDPTSNDAYTEVPYEAILWAPSHSWEGFPIEAKLSWDLCKTAPTIDIVTCDDVRQSARDFDAETWFEIVVPPDTESIVLETCADYTDIDTQLDLWNFQTTMLVATDDNGCNDTFGRSRLELTGVANDGTLRYRLQLIFNGFAEGYWQLNMFCTPILEPITCGDIRQSAWDFDAETWFDIVVPPDTESIVLGTCADYTDIDTQLDLYDSGGTLIYSDDNGCGDDIGRSKLELTGITNDGTLTYRLQLIYNGFVEGYWQLDMVCTAAPIPPPPTTTTPTVPLQPTTIIPSQSPDTPPPTPTNEPTPIPTNRPTTSPQVPTTPPPIPTTPPPIPTTHPPIPTTTTIPPIPTTPPPIPTTTPPPIPTTPPPIPTTTPPIPTTTPPIPTTPPPIPTTPPPTSKPKWPSMVPVPPPTPKPPQPATPPVSTTRRPTIVDNECINNQTNWRLKYKRSFVVKKKKKKYHKSWWNKRSSSGSGSQPYRSSSHHDHSHDSDTQSKEGCDCKGGVAELRFVYLGTTSNVQIDLYTGKNRDTLVCSYSNIQPNEEIVCNLRGDDPGTGLVTQGLDKFAVESPFVITYPNGGTCEAQYHTSCSQDIVGVVQEECKQLVVSGWKDNNENFHIDGVCEDDNQNGDSHTDSHRDSSTSKHTHKSRSVSKDSHIRSEHHLATCLVYDLIITDENTDCYGDSTSITFFMINLPPECDGDISLQQIQDVFYYNSPNNFDIVYDDITQKIGFGKKYDNGYASIKPGVPSVTEFILCFEKSSVQAFDIVDTTYFMGGDNNYYSKDGKTYVTDICKLIDTSTSESDDSMTKHGGYGYRKHRHSHGSKKKKTKNVWSKSSDGGSHECKMDDTNWNLKYKRSYVSRKKHSSRGKNKRRQGGWWHKSRDSKRKRRRMGYKYKFSPGTEEFYEDEITDNMNDELDDEEVLSSCFVYEIECNLGNSKCFGSPSKILSFSIDIPYECGNDDDVSLPEVNHAFYWSQPDTFDVVYDTIEHGLAFGLSYDGNINIPLNLGERREFTLCFRRTQLNPYNMVMSKWKADGNNQYYSIDGTIYVPDICQLRQ